MTSQVPHEHPLWLVFQDWARKTLGENVMYELYWEAFLLGVKAGADELESNVRLPRDG